MEEFNKLNLDPGSIGFLSKVLEFQKRHMQIQSETEMIGIDLK